jgi:hypothetical protein
MRTASPENRHLNGSRWRSIHLQTLLGWKIGVWLMPGARKQPRASARRIQGLFFVKEFVPGQPT